MKNRINGSPAARLALRLTGMALTCATLAGATQPASGAAVDGRVVNADGAPLSAVPVCLSLRDQPGKCLKSGSTRANGAYRFSGLKTGRQYLVTVATDRTVGNATNGDYAAFVWSPREMAVSFETMTDQLALADMVGKFNFSNFQRAITLTASDFPELSSIDLEGSYVALKVFIPSDREEMPPATIFLGRVHSAGQLQIEASIPLATPTIGYEIFSTAMSLHGVIELLEQQGGTSLPYAVQSSETESVAAGSEEPASIEPESAAPVAVEPESSAAESSESGSSESESSTFNFSDFDFSLFAKFLFGDRT